jgi:uroporphyrinogen decarboxylase
VRALHPTPVILFCRSSSLRALQLSSLNPAAISFDWNQPLHVLRHTVPAHIAVQGNFDPELLKKSQAEIAKEIEAFWAPLQKAKGVIVNLGHGVTPETPFENVQFFVKKIHHCASGGIEQRIASGLP